MQPDLITLFIIASASSVAGVLAGMLGIGGGIVIVPMLYYLLTYFGFDQSIIMHIAVGTSLFIIIPTGLRSAFEHSKRGSFDESIFRRWCIPIALGSILGSYFAGISSFKGLTLLFATLASVVSYQMFISSRKDEALRVIRHPILKSSPFFIGIFSSMMGIGGGNLSVPIMSYMGVEIKKAIGTSSALGIVIAVPGSFGVMISGQSATNLPDYSFGYVNLFYAALIIPLTILFVPVGVRFAHKFQRKRLQTLFSILLAITAVKMFLDILSA